MKSKPKIIKRQWYMTFVREPGYEFWSSPPLLKKPEKTKFKYLTPYFISGEPQASTIYFAIPVWELEEAFPELKLNPGEIVPVEVTLKIKSLKEELLENIERIKKRKDERNEDTLV